MVEIAQLPLATRIFLQAYRWQRIDPVPWAPLRKPLAETKIAIVSTAGLVPPDQAPFDDDVRGGDWSWREVPDTIDVATLVDAHRSTSYDHAGVRADPNVGFPLDRLRELGLRTNHRHYSFMGSITAPRRLMRESAPEVAEQLAADGVDAVLLVPI
ncbi:MAG TPA: glycine/sarcosine/betaine reductase selenoprotein B family protein [Thermoanaerobaculia bacterium]|nr:glycine/sarcosine/betaine reductase selenoprotein B family protein [Thermoanaerobaculia bacterium]